MEQNPGNRLGTVTRKCEYCGAMFTAKVGRGRPQTCCSKNCANRLSEQRQRRRVREGYERRINNLDAKVASQADMIHAQSLQADVHEFTARQERERREQLEKEIRMAADQIDRLFASGTLKADHDSPTWQQDRHLTQWQGGISHYAKPAEPDPYDELMELDRVFQEGKQRWRALSERAKRELPPNPTAEDRRIAGERIRQIGQREREWILRFFKEHPRLQAWYDLLDYADNFHIEYGYWPDERIAEYARLKALVDAKETKKETDPWGL
jgi:hypothetical protein